MAFEFPIDRESGVLKFLQNREGRYFRQRLLLVRLDDLTNVQAYVSIYEGPSLIFPSALQETADNVKKAAGQNGSCRDYIAKLMESLAELGIDDPSVSQLWNAVRADGGV
jgi:cation transport regulator ChaC